MSTTLLFILGLLMTLIVFAAIAPLVYAIVLDGRDAQAHTASRDTATASGQELDILETAHAAGSLDTLITAIDRAGLREVLEGRGPYTMFAPSDEAFKNLPAGTVDSLLAAPETLVDVVTYHLVPGRMTTADIRRRASAETLQGEGLAISNNGAVRIDSAHLVSGDIDASNGIIHIIDRVLLPAGM